MEPTQYGQTLRARVRAGDPDAFGKLFDEHARAVYNQGYRLTLNWSIAEEVVSLTFLEAWRLRAGVEAANGTGMATGCAYAPGQPAKPDLGKLTAYPTYKLLASLPTRPGPLLAKIKAASKKPGHPNLQVMLTISNVLINSIAPRKLTAALYQVAATTPRLHVVQHATDPHGRLGFGITFSSAGIRIEWIFNAKTARLIGERITVANNSKADRQVALRALAFTNNDG